MKKTYSDDSLKLLLGIYAFVSLLMIGVWVGVGGTKIPILTSIVILGAILLALLLIILLVYSFTDSHRVICDDESCQWICGNRWGKPITLQFAWSDVQSTRVGVNIVGSGKYRSEYVYVAVQLQNSEIELLRYNKLSADFNDLITVLNKNTSHLSYEWLPRKQVSTHIVMEEVASYCKVQRAKQ